MQKVNFIVAMLPGVLGLLLYAVPSAFMKKDTLPRHQRRIRFLGIILLVLSVFYAVNQYIICPAQ